MPALALMADIQSRWACVWESSAARGIEAINQIPQAWRESWMPCKSVSREAHQNHFVRYRGSNTDVISAGNYLSACIHYGDDKVALLAVNS
jgi:hypothetical protein